MLFLFAAPQFEKFKVAEIFLIIIYLKVFQKSKRQKKFINTSWKSLRYSYLRNLYYLLFLKHKFGTLSFLLSSADQTNNIYRSDIQYMKTSLFIAIVGLLLLVHINANISTLNYQSCTQKVCVHPQVWHEDSCECKCL